MNAQNHRYSAPMLVLGGQRVDLTNPMLAADTLPIHTVAHSLANINRYTGHALRPNCVAEHSLLVVEILERDHAVRNPSVLLAGLLHDAHECITNDLAAPAKPLLGPAWSNWEGPWQHAFATAYGLRLVYREFGDLIHLADQQACATELRDLVMPSPDIPLPADPAGWISLNTRAGMTWMDWRDAFIERYHELEYLRAKRRAGHPTAA